MEILAILGTFSLGVFAVITISGLLIYGAIRGGISLIKKIFK